MPDDWSVTTVKGEHWIVTENDQRDQLAVLRSERSRILVVLESARARPNLKEPVRVWVDGSDPVSTMLRREAAWTAARAHSLDFDPDQEVYFMRRMIAGIRLYKEYRDEADMPVQVNFSLMGFTASLNDLLIAEELGTLDPERLAETDREKELMCLYAANISVTAMRDRKQGRSHEEALARVKKTGITTLDEAATNIVAGVYQLPESDIPREPRGDKYGIFRRCMMQYQVYQ
ncbi:MAG: hypothetical protein JSW10_03510 [Pseudomonadota bacterium]|nr:MAG: hypothetical protein JSW10_03510 [Pseudomonadota bacterium]